MNGKRCNFVMEIQISKVSLVVDRIKRKVKPPSECIPAKHGKLCVSFSLNPYNLSGMVRDGTSSAKSCFHPAVLKSYSHLLQNNILSVLNFTILTLYQKRFCSLLHKKVLKKKTCGANEI